MAIEVCPELSSLGMMSPRISFSQGFCQKDGIPVEQHGLLNTPCRDFDFSLRKSFDFESSSADELFSDGKILPIQMKKRINPSSKPQPNPAEEKSADANSVTDEHEKRASKSFWGFKRSSSLNCTSRGLCPLPLLSRSKSTGQISSQNPIRNHKKSPLSSGSNRQKPPLKKGYGSNGNGLRIAPVLNVTPMFGFGGIFLGRERTKISW